MAKQVCTIALLFISFILKAQVTIINYQYELDVFRLATDLNGTIILQNDSNTPHFDRIVDLSPLEDVVNLNGTLTLKGTFVESLSPMKSLSYVKDGIYLYDNTLLNDISKLNTIPLQFLYLKNSAYFATLAFDSLQIKRLYVSDMPNLQTLSKAKLSDLSEMFSIINCPQLKQLNIAYDNDSIANIIITNNALLEDINFDFELSSLKIPQTLAEFHFLGRHIRIENNNELKSISSPKNDIGYSRFAIRNNPKLIDYCPLQKSYKLLHQLESPIVSDWANLSKQYLSGNAPPYSNYTEVIPNKDCSHIIGTFEQNNLTEKPSIYPNPNNGQQLNISGVKVGSRIKIYDVTGKEVFNTIYTATTVDLPNITKGLYFLEISSLNEPTQVLKFVVTNF